MPDKLLQNGRQTDPLLKEEKEMKRVLRLLAVMLLAAMLTACGGKEAVLKYHIADRDEAVSCFLSNEEYFDGLTECDLQYKLQKKGGTLDEYKEFGASQMEEFTDDEKAALEEAFADMEKDLKKGGYTLPKLGEITLIKSTQAEECGSGAYTHGTQIYLGQKVIDLICSDIRDEQLYGRYILWHEVFHCLTRSDPDFRKEMYSIIHFTVQDEEYAIPPSVLAQFISNPDVEHHNSYATFRIGGKDTDCFIALIATKPFEKKGDSFFDCCSAALVPVDGSDVYYMPEDAENFWEVFGKNTDYVIDPEECLADNFGYALAYGTEGMEYENPEIIEAIQAYLKK